MSEKNLEHDQTAGAGGEPTSQPSSGLGALSSDDLVALAQALDPIIQERAARAAQSQKDRRYGKLESNVNDALARFEDLVLNQKVNPDFAKWMLGVEGALNQGQPPSSVVSPTPAQGTAAKRERSAQELQDDVALYGLDANDPVVMDILRRGGERDDLHNLALARKKQPAATPASAQPVPGGSSHTEPLEELNKQIAYLEGLPNWTPAQSARYNELTAKRSELFET